MGVFNCSMFCCTLLNVHSSIAIILMGKRELIALLNLSSWCLVIVERLFLAVPRGCLQFVIVVFPDHTHLLFLVDIPADEYLTKGASRTRSAHSKKYGHYRTPTDSLKLSFPSRLFHYRVLFQHQLLRLLLWNLSLLSSTLFITFLSYYLFLMQQTPTLY